MVDSVELVILHSIIPLPNNNAMDKSELVLDNIVPVILMDDPGSAEVEDREVMVGVELVL